MKSPIISIKNLKKSYKENEVLKGVDLEIAAGDFFALLGYNGAGKSTTINILTNLTKKDSGKVLINGIDIDDNFAEARKNIGVVPQEFNFDIFAKVIDICVLQAGYYGISSKTAYERAEKILKKLSLWEKRNAKAKELSGGMKRRLMIARALIHEPKILILDEPTAGVDVELRKSMWEFISEINQSGTTIILTTHYLEEVEALCKNMAILSGGKIVETAKVSEVLQKLDFEKLILETDDDANFSQNFLQKYSAIKNSDGNIEIIISKNISLNEVFRDLETEKISVKSVRNAQNRVEALFMKYINS